MLEARRQASIARVEAAAKERAVAEAETAKKEAQAKEAEANAVASFFVNKVFGAGRPKGLPGALGHDVSLRDAIKASLPSLGRSFKGQPLVEARLRMALGFTFYDLCDYARSAEQYEHARALYTRHRGPDHPSTFSSMTELAASYRMLNRHDEAIKLYEETLAARKLPPDHRETLACMANLANCYADLNRHDEAIKLYEVTLATLRRVPNGRANMLLSMHNLALSYAALGRHEEAIKLHQEELGAFELEPPIYDNDTPNSERVNTNAFLARLVIPRDQRLWNMTHLAKNYAALNRHTEALPLLDEVLNKADRPGVNPQLIPFAITLRLRCCQKLGDLAGGRALAEMLEKRQPTDADSLVNAACCRAMTASLQAKANDEGAARLAREEADKAMVWLHKAVAAGWTNAAHMRKDTDLDFLRDREDFQKLLADLEAKSPPTPQEKK
jgi:tetratricopeptide (TPR) repeat protein